MSVSQRELEGLSPEAREAKITSLKDRIVGEQPVMGEVPFGEITLFRGVFDQSGAYRKDCVVKELTGQDEEAVARMQGGPNAQWATHFLNSFLAYGIASIGPHDFTKLSLTERISVIDGLLVGEKEFIFINILRVTFGDTRTVSVRCGSCNNLNDVTFSLSGDIPIRGMDDPQKPTYEFLCRNGTNIEYRLVTGGDQAASMQKTGLTVPEQNTLIFSRCILSVNGTPPLDALKFSRDLPAFDRRMLLTAMNEQQPGPYFEEVKLPCATCGAESTFTPQWADLLSP